MARKYSIDIPDDMVCYLSRFEFLVRTIQPKVIFAHGMEVGEKLKPIYGIDFAKDKVNHVEILGENIKVIASHESPNKWMVKETMF